MGYTHYWGFKKSPKNIENGEKLFADAVNATKNCIAQVPSELTVPSYVFNEETQEYEEKEIVSRFKLADWDGEGEPVFDNDLIRFNGANEVESCYESFEISYDGYDDFPFCKTGRCIYDVAVCIALICFKHFFGDNFSYSSDGDIEGGEEGWKLAKEITNAYFGN